ncbi:MAG: hypothetical protein R6U64_09900 [Bacteroidales bacterium]
MNESIIDIALIVTYVLLGLAALAVVAFAVFQLIVNFKKAKGGLAGMAALVAIIVISYLLASNEAYAEVGPTASQWVGGGIIATYVLIIMAFLAAVYTEISKLFK